MPQDKSLFLPIHQNKKTTRVFSFVLNYFQKICFSYTDDKPLIDNLNLHVSPGEKVAIVGPTGGGKTTIVNLLMRFYDAKSGKVLVDGKDINNLPARVYLPPKHWRNRKRRYGMKIHIVFFLL